MSGLATYLARASAPRTIWHGPSRKNYEEVILSGTPKPGHIIQIYDNAGTQTGRVHPTYGGRAQKAVLIEDSLQGKTIDDAYAAGDIGRYILADSGDRFMARVPAAALAVVYGDPLVSNGDGTLVKTAASGGSTLYSSAAASAAISNTTVATAFDKSYTIPANTLAVGDTIRIRFQGIATSTNSTDTLSIVLKIGSTTIATLAATDVANNDIFEMDITLHIRTIGASGTFVAMGTTTLFGALGTAAPKAFFLASTALDTTATQALTVNATWSVASASNSVRLDVMNVDKAGLVGGSVIAFADQDLDNSAGSSEAFCFVRAA